MTFEPPEDETLVKFVTDAHPQQDVKEKVPKPHDKPEPFLVAMTGAEKGRKYLLLGKETKIGRASRNHIQIADRMMSSEHAIIQIEDEGILISDLDSTNGTFVNGQPANRTYLQDGDVIRFGKVEMRVAIPSGAFPD